MPKIHDPVKTQISKRILYSRIPGFFEDADKTIEANITYYDITTLMKYLNAAVYRELFDEVADFYDRRYYDIGIKSLLVNNIYKSYFLIDKTKNWKYKYADDYFGHFN